MERRSTHAALRRDLQRSLPRHRIEGGGGRGITVHPETPGELQQIVRIAWDASVPVLPLGLRHQQVQPDEIHLRVDLERLSRILEYDASSGLINVQAGVSLKGLADWLSSKKKVLAVHCMGHEGIQLWEYLVQPWAGGYGPAAGHKLDQVVALAALLPHGEEMVTTLAPRRAVGPDPARLLLAGEGRFGLLTRVTLRVVEAPVRVARLAFGGTHLARHLETLWSLCEELRPMEVRCLARRRALDAAGEEGPWFTVLWTLWGDGRDLVRRKEKIIKGMTPAFSSLRLQNPFAFEGAGLPSGAASPYHEFIAQRGDLPAFCARLRELLQGERIDEYKVFGFHAGTVSVGVLGAEAEDAESLRVVTAAATRDLPGVSPSCDAPGHRPLRDALAAALDPRGILSIVPALWQGGCAP